MTAKTSGEIEKEFIDNLKASTNKDLDGWLAEIGGLGTKKRNDIIDSLKKKYGFGHMNASLLAGIYLNDGKPVYAQHRRSPGKSVCKSSGHASAFTSRS